MEAILPSSDTAPLSSVIIYCTVVATLNMSSRDEVVTLGDWTDWADSSGFWLKSRAIISASSVCSCWGSCFYCGLPRVTSAKDYTWTWSILKETSYPVLPWRWIIGSLCAAIAPWHGCNLCSLMDEVTLLPSSCSCSSSGLTFPYPILGIPCEGGCLQTTYIGVVACSLPVYGRIYGSWNTAWMHSWPCKLLP
jgi:hypothetical protein